MAADPEPQALTPGRIVLILVALVVMFALSFYRLGGDDEDELKLITFSGETMGTTYNVKVVIDPDDSLWRTEILLMIRVMLITVNLLMSTYDETSELSRFNAWDSTEPFAISRETAEVFAAAIKVSDQSAGAFDVTVGPIVNAYGFGPEPRGLAPTEDELERLRERVGYEKLMLDAKGLTLTKSRPDLYCDLSAIAKGYAVDLIARVIELRRITNYLVEVGGEVRARGLNEHREIWRIGIEEPFENQRRVHRTVALENLAMATSGDYRNAYDLNGVRVSHTIDARTGRPVTHALASVTVFHEQCMMADAYATAIMVLGPDEGYLMAELLELPALLLIRSVDGSFIERTTPAFDKRFGEAR